eukprot:symbB.v1.2.013147.t1/scaffold925.1/size151535/14
MFLYLSSRPEEDVLVSQSELDAARARRRAARAERARQAEVTSPEADPEESEGEDEPSLALVVVRAARPILRSVQWLANRVLGEKKTNLGQASQFSYDHLSGQWVLQRPTAAAVEEESASSTEEQTWSLPETQTQRGVQAMTIHLPGRKRHRPKNRQRCAEPSESCEAMPAGSQSDRHLALGHALDCRVEPNRRRCRRRAIRGPQICIVLGLVLAALQQTAQLFLSPRQPESIVQRRQLLAGSGAEKMMWTFVEVVESCRSPKALEFCPWEHQLLWPMRRTQM